MGETWMHNIDPINGEFVKNANELLEVTVSHMVRDGFLTSEKANEFMSDHIFIPIKNSWLSGTVKKMFNYKKDEEGTFSIRLVHPDFKKENLNVE